MRNDGKTYENAVYRFLKNEVEKGTFIVSQPNVRVEKGKKYYSRDRGDYIQTDISIEKYLSAYENAKPVLIIIVECKDYKGRVTVDDVEEFHTKLQQIGSDNTKGIMVTRHAGFQRSAMSFAQSKGITLAKLDCEIHREFVESVVACRPSAAQPSLLWFLLTIPVDIVTSLGEVFTEAEKKHNKESLIKEIKRLLLTVG